MKKFSQSKRWLLAGSLLLIASACQKQNLPPPSSSNEQNYERELQNREQERMDRRMEEREMIERGGNQGSYQGTDEGPSRGKCDPCQQMKKCGMPSGGMSSGGNQPREQSPYPDRNPNQGRYRDRPMDNVQSDQMKTEEAGSKEAVECTPEISVPSPTVAVPAAVEVSVPAVEEKSVVVVPEAKAEEAPAATNSETVQK